MQSYDFGLQANQLSDILCRGATVSSIQSQNNTLTRGASLRDTGDYDIPHPHPYTHHYMTTSSAATPQAMSMAESRPGSASGSGSSPGISGGSGSIGGGGGPGSIISGICSRSIDGVMCNANAQINYLVDCSHYDRLSGSIPIVPPPPQLHSEEEIEPAYATGIYPILYNRHFMFLFNKYIIHYGILFSFSSFFVFCRFFYFISL